METVNFITTSDFCVYHDVEQNFIKSLHEAGLIDIEVMNDTAFIPHNELRKLEKMIRLHHELEINVAGIEAITYLLQRIEQFQEETRLLRNKLSRYQV